MTTSEHGAPSAPRGRHAPPLEVRLEEQRRRLLAAAASVFARHGYADASAEAIAREASMSKATFYEHFGNKEESILALWDEAARFVLAAITDAARQAGDAPEARIRAGIRAFLEALASHPDEGQTLLVEIIGAGPAAARRRDEILHDFAAVLEGEGAPGAAGPRFASPLDAVAVVGAITELASRQMRLGEPADVRELEPVIDRLVLGMLVRAG